MASALVLKVLDEIKPVRKEPTSIDPQNEETKRKYFNLFTEYSTKNITQRQLAEKYGFSPVYVNRILKWCSEQLEGIDRPTYQEAMVEKVSVHLQKLDGFLDRMEKVGGGTKESIAVMAEMRRTMQLLGKAQGLMDDGKVGRPMKVEINLPNIGRGQGVGPASAKVIEGEVVE